nr:MAG TPA: hypothetical protein [Caudoviricetes sp.]
MLWGWSPPTDDVLLLLQTLFLLVEGWSISTPSCEPYPA